MPKNPRFGPTSRIGLVGRGQLERMLTLVANRSWENIPRDLTVRLNVKEDNQ